MTSGVRGPSSGGEDFRPEDYRPSAKPMQNIIRRWEEIKLEMDKPDMNEKKLGYLADQILSLKDELQQARFEARSPLMEKKEQAARLLEKAANAEDVESARKHLNEAARYLGITGESRNGKKTSR